MKNIFFGNTFYGTNFVFYKESLQFQISINKKMYFGPWKLGISQLLLIIMILLVRPILSVWHGSNASCKKCVKSFITMNQINPCSFRFTLLKMICTMIDSFFLWKILEYICLGYSTEVVEHFRVWDPKLWCPKNSSQNFHLKI